MKPLRLFLFLITFQISLTASAYTFTVDGIYYKILSETEKTVAVTANDGRYNSSKYTGDVVIPTTVTFAGTTYNVTEIAWYAFSSCDLTSVSIPDGITSIGGHAFQSCYKLASIEIPNGINKIEEYTFYGCSGLTSIEIPSSVESIGDHAFFGCKGLLTISLGNVSSIGDYAFAGGSSSLAPYNYPNLHVLDIPSSVESIGDYAFAYQVNLQTLTLHEGLKKIGKYAFNKCENLTSVSIPGSVEYINSCAFYECRRLSTVNASTIAPKYMGSNVFYGTLWYDNLSDGMTYLGQALFKYKGTMPENTELSIPAGTTCIAGIAFSAQTGLKSVTIPSSIRGIGASAFSGCTALETVNIPEGIEEVGARAFYNTPYYNNQPDGMVYVGNIAYRYKGEMPENTALELRAGTTAILDTAFYNCTNLASIIIPNSVKAIGKQAFSGCSSLASVTVPGISTINEKTFENCTNLEEVTLQDGTNVIDQYAFSGCTNLTNINWPSSIKDIRDYVFQNCRSITSMTLPEGLYLFGDYVFSGCTNLTSVSFPSTLGGGFSGQYTFNGISNIKEARFHSRKTVTLKTYGITYGLLTGVGSDFDIYKFIYYVPHGLREEYELQISSNDRILEMGEDENIVEFADPEVQRICIANYDANLSGTVDEAELGEVHYPMIASMSYFYKQNFQNNTTITSFDEFRYFTNCTNVPSSFFSGCSNLSSITLPITVTNISADAFNNCPLTSLTVLNPIPATCISYSNSTSTSNPFSNQQNCKLYVPEGSKAAYQAADYWKLFPVIIEVYEGASQELQDLMELSGTLQIELNHAVEGTKKGQYPAGSKAICQAVIDDVNLEINKNISHEKIVELTERLIEAKNDFESKIYLIGSGESFTYQPEGSSSALIFSITSRDPDIVTVGPNQSDNYDSFTNSYVSYYTGDIVIPESVVWKDVEFSVRGISSYAFRNSTITSVSIPKSIKSIGEGAFEFCTGLTEVHISDLAAWCGISFQYIVDTRISNPLGYAGHLYLNGEEVTDLVIPNSVTSIGNFAFHKCSGLTSVTIPNSVTSIGNSAFGGCSGLTSVTIPNSVTSIGYYAFGGCSGLTSITIPNSVTSIGNYAFYNCSGLTSITIPNSVTSIGNSAFYNCSGLTSITIPNSVTSIANDAFSCCSGLTSISVASGNTAYNSRNDCNAIIETASNTLIFGCQNSVIPNSVTSIGNSAFYNCSGLTSITIPNSVTSIGGSAFYNCRGLTSVVSEIETPFTLGSYVFNSISSSCTLTVPSGTREAYINAGWTTSVFKGGIIDLSEPDFIYLEVGNFFTAKTIEDVSMTFRVLDVTLNTVQVGNNSCSINSNTTGGVTIPNKVVYGGKEYTVTSIGNYAFRGCSGLTSVTIPSSVTSIGFAAFAGCSGLTSVKVDLETPLSISSSTFSNRNNTTLYVPAGSKAVYEEADYWKEFNEIVEISHPSPFITFADVKVKALCVANWDSNQDGEIDMLEAAAVTSLGEVFSENAEIISFDELQYFTGLRSINNYAFSDCSGLTSVTIPNSVTSIGESAFSCCSGLTSVTIPSSVTSIGYAAFYACSGLTSVTIPSSVTSIGSYAFWGCDGLTSVTIPSSVTSIGYQAFDYCSGLTSIYVDSANGTYDSRDNSNAIIETTTNALVAGCKNTIIPSSVTSIVDYAFSGCSGLTSVTIPSSVTSIGSYAFWGCDGLTSVTIPSSVTCIGDGAFNYCFGLTSIYVDSANGTYDSRDNSNAIIETTTNALVAGCKNTIIPSSVTSIGASAFSGCSGLTSVTIPSSVTSIGDAAFYDCPALTSITIPSSVTSIGGSAFYGCSALTSVTIPSSVTSIGNFAFYDCDGLTSVTIPSSVTSIGDYAFNGCYGLTNLKVDLETPLSIGFDTFSNRENAALYVPVGSGTSYSNADYWKEFKRIIEFVEGDVNGDGESDVVDVVDIARYVVGTAAETFVPILADIDNSGDVNIGDAVALVNEIAGDQNFVKAMRAPRRAETTDEALRLMAAGNGLSLILENQRDYTAFQFDLFVPEGTDVAQMLLNAQRKQKHQLLYNKVEEGHYRVAAISTSNRKFQGNDGELLSFVVSGGGDVAIRDIHFFDTEGGDYMFNEILYEGTTTGIAVTPSTTPMDGAFYTIDGRRIGEKPTTKGLYIVNGKKVVIK